MDAAPAEGQRAPPARRTSSPSAPRLTSCAQADREIVREDIERHLNADVLERTRAGWSP